MLNKLSEISVIIPTYNEESVIFETINELKKIGIEEIIVIDGGSKDKTLDIVKSMQVSYVEIGFRSGYGDAFIRGLKYCKNKYVCKINADGSFDPKYLFKMLEILEKDIADVVFNSRYLESSKSYDDTFIRKLGNFIFTNFCKIFFSTPNTDILYNYHMSKKSNYESIDLRYKDFSICTEIPIKFYRNNYVIHEIPSIERARRGGVSKVNAFIDGFKILFSTSLLFFNKKLIFIIKKFF